MGQVHKIIDIFIKVFLLGLGIADFVGILPDSLDILDKALAAIILAYFWFQLGFSSFLFGTKKKRLDWTILIAFYVLVADSFFQLIRVMELDAGFTQTAGTVVHSLPGFVSSPFKSIFLFIHNPANATTLSTVSLYLGFLMLLGISLYAASSITYTKKSVMHSFARIFIRKEKNWKNFADTKGVSVVLKFALSFLVLFSIYQYFFALVNQWFVVSLDKTLLILALLFALKDIKGTKSKALNTIGNFDNWLLSTITDLFTNKKKFLLAFGILLIFHYLSDLATFFLPYFIPHLGIDPFYLSLLGDPSGALHQPLASLLTGSLVMNVPYYLAAIGILVFLFFPIYFLYLLFSGTQLKEVIDTYGERLLILFFTLCSLVYLMVPWVHIKTVKQAGIQGVDFITGAVSFPSWLFFVVIGLFLLIFLLARYEVVARRSFLLLFMGSFTYFGYYVWNYFLSSFFYHINIIKSLFLSQNYFLLFLFFFSFLLELLFYLGVFLQLLYKASLLITHQIEELTNRFTYWWTGLILLLPLLLVSFGGEEVLTITSILLLVFVVFVYALHQRFKGKEFRDDYLFALTSIIASYQFSVILGLFLFFLGLSHAFVDLFVAFLLIIVSYIFLRYFKLPWQLKLGSLKKVLLVLLLGFLFSILFFLAQEPIPFILSPLLVLLFTLFVAVGEEFLFRGVVFGLALKSFSAKLALHMQAIIFSLVHLVNLPFLLSSFQVNTHLLGFSPFVAVLFYGLSLYVFSLVAAKLMKAGKKRSLGPAILFHWLVNMLLFFLF